MRNNFLTFGAPFIKDEEIKEVLDTLESGWLGTGPKTKLFEKNFSKYIGSKNAIALNSCTAGLHLALDSFGIGMGDEVISTPMTFPATINVIEHVGAKPVFVDVKRNTFNIDENKIEAAITSDTKAIIPVHLAGRPCEMETILSIAKKYDLKVIEDAAHATESYYSGNKIGNTGDVTCFSFYVTKNIVTGEGGMLTTNNNEIAEMVRTRSLHGISKDAWNRFSDKGYSHYETKYPGYKYNMIDIQASLGIHQLNRVDESLLIRNKHWDQYNQAFKNLDEIDIPLEQKNIVHARHLYTIILRLKTLKINRDQFIIELKNRNIGSGIHYTAVHLHQYYKHKYSYKKGDYPNSEWISERTISLPLSPKITSKDISDVISSVLDIIKEFRL